MYLWAGASWGRKAGDGEESESRGKGGNVGRRENLGKDGKEGGKWWRFWIEIMGRNGLRLKVGAGCETSLRQKGLGHKTLQLGKSG